MSQRMIRAALASMGSVLILAACSPPPTAPAIATVTRTPIPTATDDLHLEPAQDLARSDSQGAVEFVVEPVNLTGPSETLDFKVSMNTHSVDVSWDLAAQSVLEADTGRQVLGRAWPIGGGHHYEGTLSFPRLTAEGDDLLEGASILRLIIRDTDVPERTFTWEFPG